MQYSSTAVPMFPQGNTKSEQAFHAKGGVVSPNYTCPPIKPLEFSPEQ